MTNPCYDFALRPQSNISDSYVERRHTPQRPRSPATPSSQESLDDLEFSRQRGDRGRWKTDGRISIAGGVEGSNTHYCHCQHCACTREKSSSRLSPRRTRTARRPPSSGNGGLDQQQGCRKRSPSVPKVDNSLWNPMQLLRRPHTSPERERERETSKHRSSSRLKSETPSRSRDVRESYPLNRVPHRPSKVRSLRRNPLQQRKLSPRNSPPGRCSSRIPPVSSRRWSSIDTPSPLCTEKFDIGCQTRRDEFPLTPEETPRASPIRRVFASNSFHGRPSHNANLLSYAGQRTPSSCKCGSAACPIAPAPPPALRECCCSVCVGWQERTHCQKSLVAQQASCQGSRHGNCCAVIGCHQGNHHQSCHQGSHHGVCPRAEQPSGRHSECSKCHQLLPPNK